MRRRSEPIPPLLSEAEERQFWESDDSTGHVDWRRAERGRLPDGAGGCGRPRALSRRSKGQDEPEPGVQLALLVGR
jgi:hypothetical protein